MLGILAVLVVVKPDRIDRAAFAGFAWGLVAALGTASWPRRRVVGLTVAFAVCPVWAGLVPTDGLAPAGRALFPLNATTLALSLAGHLVYGAVLGYGLWLSRHRTGPSPAPAGRDLSWSHPRTS
jgi:hypothetical protein